MTARSPAELQCPDGGTRFAAGPSKPGCAQCGGALWTSDEITALGVGATAGLIVRAAGVGAPESGA